MLRNCCRKRWKGHDLSLQGKKQSSSTKARRLLPKNSTEPDVQRDFTCVRSCTLLEATGKFNEPPQPEQMFLIMRKKRIAIELVKRLE